VLRALWRRACCRHVICFPVKGHLPWMALVTRWMQKLPVLCAIVRAGAAMFSFHVSTNHHDFMIYQFIYG
jgi:hypothetical protein